MLPPRISCRSNLRVLEKCATRRASDELHESKSKLPPATLVGVQATMTAARRGKKDTTKDTGKDAPTEEEILIRAEAAVRQNQATTEQLHRQWKRHLKHLSWLLIVISFHQTMSPTTSCLKDIKALNEVMLDEDRIDGWKAMSIVLSDSVEHILGIVLAAADAFYLGGMEQTDHSKSPPMMLANACIAPILGIHFSRPPQCVDALLDRMNLGGNERIHGFPVILVFHVIVLLCLWFMNFQRLQVEYNVQRIAQVRAELTTPKKTK